MQYLTPSQIKKVAPAITRLPPSEDKNLVDTTSFLRHVETLGYRTVLAVQGTPHSDARSQSRGRHLAVAANQRGEALVILNSHTVWRRAWLGVGWNLGSAYDGASNFMVGAVVPLPRWRGFEEPLTTLLGYLPSLRTAKNALLEWTPNIHQRRWMARNYASTAYLPGHKTPLPKEILIESDQRALSILAVMLSRVRAGGLKPNAEPVGGLTPRKLKPVQAPDALFKASNAAFQTGFAAMAKYRVGTFAFPSFNGRDANGAA